MRKLKITYQPSKNKILYKYMGKHNANERMKNQVGRMAPPENEPRNDDDADPMKVLNNIKKKQLIEYYANKYGLSEDLLNNIYDYLQKCTPHRIKQIKKGNIKNVLKRKEYRDGDILQGGKVIRNTLDETLKNESERILKEIKVKDV